MTTVYDATPVVNPVHGQLGDGMRDLYDWLRLRTRQGRTRRVEELTPPGIPRYEQLADRLRRRIFDGSWPGDASGPVFGSQYGVSQTAVQKAFEILEREGLVLMEHGRRTTVLPRRPWRVEFEIVLPPDGPERETATREAADALARTVAGQPAVSGAEAAGSKAGLFLRMTVESADLGGAVTAALAVARLALGSLPAEGMTARKAGE